MKKQIKKIYKCHECETVITIVTKVHELPESIICPCDNVAENQGTKWKSLTINHPSTKLKEQKKIRKEYKTSHIYQSLSVDRLHLESK